MSGNVSEVSIIKRLMYTYLAQMAWDETILEKIDDLPERIISERAMHYRCCEHKEKAILKESIRVALGLTPEDVGRHATLAQMATQALNKPPSSKKCTLEMLAVACDRCPIDKFVVTDACRNCVAHHCQTVCPKDAITIVHNRAYIDRTKCTECGLCARSCRYNAIIQITRPCEQACVVHAIKRDKDNTILIDCDSCVGCAACVTACPFGSVADYTQLLTVVSMLKQKNQRVHALLAPSFVGQFGPKASPPALVAALGMLGFDCVHEVAAGAEQVARAEAAEFAERLSAGHNFMTSSCCPSFVRLVQGHYPELAGQVSHTPSPMVVRASQIKEQYPEALTVFIGPCIAKKSEASSNPQVDAVLTFEELGCLFVSRGINVAAITAIGELKDSGPAGRGFGKSGGVTKALQGAIAGKLEFAVRIANGLSEAVQVLEE
ncbi:MAG: monomeric [FeFe] hydrogenase, partial [Bacillota bacterium]|nr:monomeric [FeFe] hydrogenase [Bacillota bacterium]